MNTHRRLSLATVPLLGLALLLIGANGVAEDSDAAGPGADGPNSARRGRGRDVFRFATFGNERYWTDAIRLQQGFVSNEVTPLDALRLGLSVDSKALDAATLSQITKDLKADPSAKTSALLNDPATTVKLVNADAIIGLSPKDSNRDGNIDIANGDKTGATCALCHTITDRSVFSVRGGGSIGRRLDGRAPHTLKFGALVALGENSRAFYPELQLALDANGGATLGRSPNGLTENSTEAEVDAYLNDPNFYPPGMFDDTVDGNGDPMHNMPLFRQDLAFPFGSDGAIGRLENFSNLVYTALLDPTTLTTPGGRAFLKKLGGDAAGDEIADDFAQVLTATGVSGPFPFVEAAPPPDPAVVGTEPFPVGLRVDNTMLLDMNEFLFRLKAPRGAKGGKRAISRGRQLFRTAGCTDCHNVDQRKPVPPFIVPMKTIFPGDDPVVLLAERMPPLNPILDTPGNIFSNPINIFDDKMAVVNASLRGDVRGTGLPLLLDLARKPVFLHDNSVPSLAGLFDPNRGATAPHPFFLPDPVARAHMVMFLRSLDTARRRK